MPSIEDEEIFKSLPDEEQAHVAGFLSLIDQHRSYRVRMFIIKLMADDILANSYEASKPDGYKRLVTHMQGLVKGNKK